ncbi:hypothetical protein [Micromonospora coxensis]|uniref:hypothetical protein n=1 Tax=Micromonospora coxensis TaxID=356852 RepID=UPI001E535BC8|nr:hypothetical protein [Micromonospora coxensis]
MTTTRPTTAGRAGGGVLRDETTAPAPRRRPPDPSTAAVGGTVWQVQVRTRLDDLQRQLRALESHDAANADRAAELRQQLAGVESVLGRGGVLEWLRGGSVEYAWRTVHAVERGMVDLRTPQELTGLLPAYQASAAQFLKADHPARTAFDATADRADPALLRAKVQTLLLCYHRASDEFHESVRHLRNRMLGLSLVALAVETLMVLAQWRSPDVRLIEAPADAAGVPAWRLLLFVLAAGALGAFVSALPTMITSRSGGVPYKLPLQQGLLKLAVGPLVAVVGIMLVIGGLVETTVGSTGALLALAVVFGAGQQAVTGYADRKAATLLSPVTPKD